MAPLAPRLRNLSVLETDIKTVIRDVLCRTLDNVPDDSEVVKRPEVDGGSHPSSTKPTTTVTTTPRSSSCWENPASTEHGALQLEV